MLAKSYDSNVQLAKDYQPFSDALNKWYTRLWTLDPESRPTSALLMKELIPSIDCYIDEIGQTKTNRTDSMLAMPSPPMRPQAPTPRRMAGIQTPRASDRRSSYEGNDYAVLSWELRMREID